MKKESNLREGGDGAKQITQQNGIRIAVGNLCVFARRNNLYNMTVKQTTERERFRYTRGHVDRRSDRCHGFLSLPFKGTYS